MKMVSAEGFPSIDIMGKVDNEELSLIDFNLMMKISMFILGGKDHFNGGNCYEHKCIGLFFYFLFVSSFASPTISNYIGLNEVM